MPGTSAESRRSGLLRALLVGGALLALGPLAPALADHLPPGGTFPDDNGNVHEPMIEAIFAEGITLGCSVSPPQYCPTNPVRRDQMASFIARAYELPSSSNDWFPDDDGNVHEDNINRLAQAGISLGFPDGTYRPHVLVRRDQMASFLARADSRLLPPTRDWFGDDNSNVHEGNINTIAENGVTLGCGATNYCPDSDVRRDQMASFLGRALGLDLHPPGSTTTTSTATTMPGVLVGLPFRLDWDQDEGGPYDDKDGTGTGFTWIDQPTSGTGYIPANLDVDPGSSLKMTTTAGLAFEATNSQDNALAVGIPPPADSIQISAVLSNPPAGTGGFEQAGIWFGNDEDNYVKLVVMSTGGETQIHSLLEVAGAQVDSDSVTVGDLTSSTVELVLVANPADGSTAASYRIDGGGPIGVGAFTSPDEFFSGGSIVVDPAIGTATFGGIFASHRNGTAPLQFAFDSFSVDTASPPQGPITFATSSFGVPTPTAMVWGPDGHLYVTEIFGTIHELTLNGSHNVVNDNVITTLTDAYGGNRLALGITVDPASTPTDVIVWVSHSSGQTFDGVANSGTVSKISGTSLETIEHVITGLPRSIGNHATNAIHFGPDNRLYIAQGGNTSTGGANDSATEHGSRPEQYLSAALLVADVDAAGFEGDCADPTDPTTMDATGVGAKFKPTTCDVEIFATGIRNMYDFWFHSNGLIYGPDNGKALKGTVPQQPTPDCQGLIQYDEPVDPLDPGVQSDLFLLISEGHYYGHPNPARDECVFRDGSFQGVSPLLSYTPPLVLLGPHQSADGITEYTSSACPALQGELLVANYSLPNNITRFRLNASGTTVSAWTELWGGLNNPLAISMRPDGAIYVSELNAGRITVLVPTGGC